VSEEVDKQLITRHMQRAYAPLTHRGPLRHDDEHGLDLDGSATFYGAPFELGAAPGPLFVSGV
jgi:hypothetical protein